MALLFMDGFDHYQESSTSRVKWDSPVGTSGGLMIAGRFGGQAMVPKAATNAIHTTWPGISKRLTSDYSTLIVGFAVRFKSVIPDNFTHPFFTLIDASGKHQLQFWIDGGSGELKLGVAHPDLPVGPYNINWASYQPDWYDATGYVPPIGLWIYFEVKATAASTTTGTVQIHVDSSPILEYTNVKTMNTGVAGFRGIRFMGTNYLTGSGSSFDHVAVDDLYMADATGTFNNDFLGEVRVQTRYPDAEGYQNDFYPAIGDNNAAMVDTPITNWTENSGEYVYSGAVGAIDLYSIQNFTSSGSIFGVQVNVTHRKDDVGNRRVAPMLRIGGTNYEGDDFPLYSDYTWAGHIFEKNPNNDLPWDLTQLNQAEFGLKITA